MYRPIAAALAAVLLTAAPAFAADPALQAAVDSPSRADADRARDIYRHPYETLSFWGVKPGATVLELVPGGGYWTDILAPYAKATGGHYITTISLRPGAVRPTPFEAKVANADRYGKVQFVDFTLPGKGFGPANSVDVAFTARNIHNWMAKPGQVDAVFADLYAVLKPGGLLGVEEHRADPRPMKEGASDGYVSEAFVIAAAKKAGFVLDARSETNANPRDTKDHPFGVWTLPPSRSTGPKPDPAFDHSRYDAIGESDRMTLRFRKPE